MDSQSDSQSSPPPPPSSLAWAQLAVSTLLSLAVVAGIIIRWDRIPDWRYALAALLIAAFPTDSVSLLKEAIKLKLGK